MPDKDQRQRLLPFVGEFVRVSGTVFERKGTRGITVKETKEFKDMKGVHGNRDAKSIPCKDRLFIPVNSARLP
jgi:hypothetical protein